jgi:putative ABC transport system permease protein
MQWGDYVEIGVKGLLVRRLRSLLSTLGIVFGVAAVIGMMSIGEGARRQAIEEIELLGTNNVRVKQLHLTGEAAEDAERRFSRGLTYDDMVDIRGSVPDSVHVAPLAFIDAEVRAGARQSTAQVVGTSPSHEDVTNFRVGEGRFLTHVDVLDSKRVCILGADVKDDLIGFRSALGSEIRIGDTWFTVVGVMEAKRVREKRATVIKVRNINRDVFIPITAALRRFARRGDPAAIDEIAIRVRSAEELAPVSQVINRLLERTHRGVKDYEVVIPEELLAQAQRTQRLFNMIMSSIAGVALLVGGIGIMNIMLANVSERTAFSGVSVAIAFGTAALVGLLFGLYPARRAAELHPVQALRSE